MNIDDAVRVLNEHGHGDGGEWRIVQVHKDEKLVADSDLFEPGGRYLLEFEAIAIAEKLMRDAGRDLPATRWLAHKIERVLAPANALEWHDDSRFSGGGADPVTYGDLRAFAAEWEVKP